MSKAARPPCQLDLGLMPCGTCGANRPQNCRGWRTSRYTGAGYAAPPGGGPEGETCGSCRHAVEFRGRGRWYKCALLREGWTTSAHTDIKVRAPACERWEAQPAAAPANEHVLDDYTLTAISELLPESLKDIEAAIGSAATLRLVERWGGTRLSVPPAPGPGPGHELARVLGRSAAHALSAVCGGIVLEVPYCAAARRAARDAAIVARARAGERAAALAREYGITLRAVRRVLSQAR